MKDFDLKSAVILKLLLISLIAIFAVDFLPRNYNEFQRICSQMWSKDATQYEICMEPYYREINLDKFAIGAGMVGLVLVPTFYILNRKKNKTWGR